MAKFKQIASLTEMLKSPEIVAVLEGIGEQVLALAQSDPNPLYVETLEMQTFYTRDRAHVQVGAAPGIGMAVEAKRGTLARALAGVAPSSSDPGKQMVNYTTRDGRTRKATQAQVDAWTGSRTS